MTASATHSEIQFQRVNSPEDLRDSGEHHKFTIAEHEKIQVAFQEHLGRPSGIADSRAARPRCHIIACYVGPDGTTCHYHCV